MRRSACDVGAKDDEELPALFICGKIIDAKSRASEKAEGGRSRGGTERELVGCELRLRTIVHAQTCHRSMA